MSEPDIEQVEEGQDGEQVEGVPAAPVESPGEPSEDEQADEDEQNEQQGEPDEPEQPQGLSEKQMEQAFGKLERETTRHVNRVQEIMGDDAQMLVACPLCEPLIPGFVMPTPATPERFPAVREFMGDSQPRELRADAHAHTCETCGGFGEVLTGSKVMGQDALPCVDCGGKGWVGQRVPSAITQPPTPSTTGNGGVTGPTAQPPLDPPDVAALKARGYVVIAPAGS